jgi:hypothetical protein
MRNLPQGLKTTAFIIVVILLLSQAFRIDRANPPVRLDLVAAPDVKSVLRRACYDCHSNETVWPWYSGVAPVSWLVGSDVKGARRHLNFSEWGTYDAGKQSNKLSAIAEEVRDGEMPLWYYSMIHRDSRLDASDQAKILAWTEEASRSGAK